jgi:tRNA nucleotidyltransferase (CCA-adding enzyme)
MSQPLYEVDIMGGLARLRAHDDLLTRLHKHIGKPTYLVGGPVRDALLGRESKDLDVVTIGNQEDMDRFERSGAKRIKQDFPVFTHPDFPEVEVAFGRKERKTGEGHIAFDWDLAPDLATDLARRDFTINAMAYHPQHGIVDPLGGLDHLKSGILSATTDAFSEDPVRILRGARFASQLGMSPDERTISLMRAGAGELPTEHKERVRTEMNKALDTPHADKFFRTLASGKALGQWFPEIDALQNTPAGPEKYHPEGSAFEHTMLALKKAGELGHSPSSKLLTLLHDTGKARTDPAQWPSQIGHEKISEPAVDFARRLDLGKGVEKEVATHVLNHMVPHRLHRPGTIVDYFGRVNRMFEPHIQAVVADAGGKGLPYEGHPYEGAYRKMYDTFKASGREPNITVDQRRQARSQAVAQVLRDVKGNLKEDKLPGGKGDKKSKDDFDPEQVSMGLKVELEHTDSKEVALEIVLDHLTEDPNYYSKLKRAGLADELQTESYATLINSIVVRMLYEKS